MKELGRASVYLGGVFLLYTLVVGVFVLPRILPGIAEGVVAVLASVFNKIALAFRL